MMKKRFLAIASIALFCFSLAFFPSGAFAQVISTFVGGGLGDGQPATKATVPAGDMVFDGAGNLYAGSPLGIQKIDVATGIASTIAGNKIYPYLDFGVDGSLATATPVSSSAFGNGIAIDRAGNLYTAEDSTHRIRKVDAATGIVTTVAGTGTDGFSGDGLPSTMADLSYPSAVTIDRLGNLYIADWGNHRVRKVVPGSDGVINGGNDEIITTVAGGCDPYSGSCPLEDGGPATLATLNYPIGLAVDRLGNVYISEESGRRVRKVDVTLGIITTIAGTGQYCYYTDSTSCGDGGLATEASFGRPTGMILDRVGNLYIADMDNDRVRKVDLSTGVIITVAGGGWSSAFPGDGGPSTAAYIRSPSGVAFDGDGNLYIAAAGIRKVAAGANGIINGTADEIITTVAGGPETWGFSGEGGLATDVHFASMTRGVAVDPGRNLYFVALGHLLKVDATTRIVTTIADNIGYVEDLAVDRTGNVFISGGSVRKVDATTGTITTVADGGMGISVDNSGNVYIADLENKSIRKVDLATGIITTVVYNVGTPTDVELDGSGNVFISDYFGCRILRLSTSGIITTVAGRNGICGFSGDGGPAIQASLGRVNKIAVDEMGNIFIADDFNLRIRKVDAVTGIITTIAGNGQGCFSLNGTFCGDGGPSTTASFSYGGTSGIATDSTGNVYVADQNYLIRRISSLNQPPVLRFPGNHTLMAGSQLSVPIVALGPENSDSIVLSAANLPSFVTFTDYGNKTGLLTLSPPIGLAGSFPQIRVTATDSSGLMAERVFTITVRNGDTLGVPAGNDVSVTSGTGVEVTFPSVSTGGSLSVTASLTGPTPPAGFQVSNPPLYPDPVFYDITTTLIPGTDFSGLVTVCINWQEGQFASEDGLQLLHYESGTWTTVTTSVDTTQNRICGQVSSLSPFLIAQRSNTPPVVAPAGGGRFELGSDIVLVGTVSDLDGDLLSYRWLEGQTVLASRTIFTTLGGAPVSLPPVTLAGGLPLGLHTLTLEASDGVNAPVSAQVSVEVTDMTAPTLNPLPNTTLLWPPDHQMVEVVIQTNARDNSGLSPTLAVQVSSSEPPEVDGSGNTIPDVLITGVDQAAGLFYLQLRAERAGAGAGRVYTVMITATDASGNSSTASVQIKAPHDRRAVR